MGYASGVRSRHAGGHLREPALEIVEALASGDDEWRSQADDVDGEPFPSSEAAYSHLGRLWHCTDTVPATYRDEVESLTGQMAWTYAQLARQLRAYMVDAKLISR